MKVTNGTILNSVEALSTLNGLKLPIKVAYAINKNIYKVDSELKVFSKSKSMLIEKYGVKDENGEVITSENGTVTIEPAFVDEWNNDYNELLNIEVECDFHLIQLDDLLNSDCEITPSELKLIDYLIAI